MRFTTKPRIPLLLFISALTIPVLPVQAQETDSGAKAVIATQYTRATGAPVNACQEFHALPSRGTVSVVNGGSNGKNRVSSAVVELNGTVLLSQRFFNQKQTGTDIDVFLQRTNRLCTRLASAPNSGK